MCLQVIVSDHYSVWKPHFSQCQSTSSCFIQSIKQKMKLEGIARCLLLWFGQIRTTGKVATDQTGSLQHTVGTLLYNEPQV